MKKILLLIRIAVALLFIVQIYYYDSAGFTALAIALLFLHTELQSHYDSKVKNLLDKILDNQTYLLDKYIEEIDTKLVKETEVIDWNEITTKNKFKDGADS